MVLCTECGFECEDGARFCPGCGSSLAAAQQDSTADPYVGRKLKNTFLIEKLIGEGGMGKVYLGTQLSLDKKVAIKILHKHLFSADKNIALRFHREAKSASQIDHPNSIRIIDFGQMEEDGSLFIAMEHLNGKELTDIIASDFPFTAKRLVSIIGQVCGVLAEAHDKGIIHRDMKPDNIIIIKRPEQPDFVKVLDFGIAKLMDREGPRLTMEGMVCGTPEYMSPEQAMGKDLDPRSDIYALGCILYEMLTLQVPFEGGNYSAILTSHVRDPAIPPSQRRPDLTIHKGLEAVCLRAMAKRKEDRYEDCIAMKDALDAALAGEAPAPTPTPAAEPAPDPKNTMNLGSPAAPPSAPEPPPQPAANPGPMTIDMSGISGDTPPNGSNTIQAAPGVTLVMPPQKSNTALIAVLSVLVVAVLAIAGFMVLGNNGNSGETAAPKAAVATPPAATPETKKADTAAKAAAIPGPAAEPIAVEHDPKRAKKLYKEAMRLMNSGETVTAIKYFKESIAHDTALAKAHKYLGDCYMQQGDTGKAAPAYKEYLRLKPNAPEKQFLQEFIKTAP